MVDDWKKGIFENLPDLYEKKNPKKTLKRNLLNKIYTYIDFIYLLRQEILLGIFHISTTC